MRGAKFRCTRNVSSSSPPTPDRDARCRRVTRPSVSRRLRPPKQTKPAGRRRSGTGRRGPSSTGLLAHRIDSRRVARCGPARAPHCRAAARRSPSVSREGRGLSDSDTSAARTQPLHDESMTRGFILCHCHAGRGENPLATPAPRARVPAILKEPKEESTSSWPVDCFHFFPTRNLHCQTPARVASISEALEGTGEDATALGRGIDLLYHLHAS